jgi:hypothetical protein
MTDQLMYPDRQERESKVGRAFLNRSKQRQPREACPVRATKGRNEAKINPVNNGKNMDGKKMS